MEKYADFNMKMETEMMATKALELMKDVLTHVNADGFVYDSRETIDRFANNLMVKGSEIVDTQSQGLMPETYDIVLPEMFKAVARSFASDKFAAKIVYDSTYAWEIFEISYEGGKLTINSLYHDNCEEPYCTECDDYYEYFEENGVAGYRCCDCGHTITVEEFKAACEQYFENIYEILLSTNRTTDSRLY